MSVIRKFASLYSRYGKSVPIVESLPQLYHPPVLDKRSKRRLIRWGIISGNVLLLLAVGIFVITNRSASHTIRSNTLNSAVGTASSLSNPLDELSSAQIALNVAQMAKLSELTAIRNQADSDSLLLSMVPNDSTVLAKPQVVATAQKSKHDIIRYTTQSGDTVSGLAEKFGVSANSIRWSNNLAGDSISAGVKLVIPPVNGIVYKVKSGDTPASLAQRYRSDERLIIVYNDAEVNGLRAGELIIIPNGRVQATITYGSFAVRYGGNGYDYGYCTWYVASKVAVPTNWGNANTWDEYARLSGWTVSSIPKVGAIGQSDRGWAGHVAVVDAVRVGLNGVEIKYSDMNGLAGWGRIGHSDWIPASYFPDYIYR
ncbi:LysM peptidoglycan-binding domain-containing protein [Candidatus Saccharibacteria bacterium]|nr:LysM peptidoglycan-binding domain-containing protein [Candidatus Saccharibacteria bacterium]MBI2285634.1 LysM peptidoglycan-binding domain-containing protein [Candidatus Saccharibacteria bacterium]